MKCTLIFLVVALVGYMINVRAKETQDYVDGIKFSKAFITGVAHYARNQFDKADHYFSICAKLYLAADRDVEQWRKGHLAGLKQIDIRELADSVGCAKIERASLYAVYTVETEVYLKSKSGIDMAIRMRASILALKEIYDHLSEKKIERVMKFFPSLANHYSDILFKSHTLE